MCNHFLVNAKLLECPETFHQFHDCQTTYFINHHQSGKSSFVKRNTVIFWPQPKAAPQIHVEVLSHINVAKNIAKVFEQDVWGSLATVTCVNWCLQCYKNHSMTQKIKKIGVMPPFRPNYMQLHEWCFPSNPASSRFPPCHFPEVGPFPSSNLEATATVMTTELDVMTMPRHIISSYVYTYLY